MWERGVEQLLCYSTVIHHHRQKVKNGVRIKSAHQSFQLHNGLEHANWLNCMICRSPQLHNGLEHLAWCNCSYYIMFTFRLFRWMIMSGTFRLLSGGWWNQRWNKLETEPVIENVTEPARETAKRHPNSPNCNATHIKINTSITRTVILALCSCHPSQLCCFLTPLWRINQQVSQPVSLSAHFIFCFLLDLIDWYAFSQTFGSNHHWSWEQPPFFRHSCLCHWSLDWLGQFRYGLRFEILTNIGNRHWWICQSSRLSQIDK